MNIDCLFKPREQISLESYLNKMGIEDTKEYLSPTGLALEDPFSYTNMHEAIESFKLHYENLDKTYILCDSSDLDGYSSTISLISYMHLLNPSWDIEILLHPDKTRGLQDPTVMDKIIRFPRPFLVIPDAGTNDREQTKTLKSAFNIDILVLDHHSLSTPIEDGILINNQVGNVDKFGSGGVVTHIFMRALDIELGVNYSGRFIDLISLSVLSDGMDVKSLQNRTYLYYGIFNKDKINNPLLLQFFEDYIGDKVYNQKDILFSVVPKVNSVGRSDGYELKEQMVKGFLGFNVEEASKMCGEKHKEQIEAVNGFIENNIDKIDDNNKVILFASEDVHRTYSGLLAGKIKDKFGNKPTIIGHIEDGVMTGSLRSDIPLRTILDECKYTLWAQGHEGQCGVSINEDNISNLIEYLNSIDLPKPSNQVVVKSLSAKSIKDEYFNLFNGYEELWNSNSLPKPIFHIKNITINTKDINIIGRNKRTLKFRFNGVDYIIFNSLKEDKESLLLGYYNDKDKFIEDNKNEKINLEILGYLSTNEWNGKITNQVIIEKYEIVENKKVSIDDIF